MTSPPNITTGWNATTRNNNFTTFTKVQLHPTLKEQNGLGVNGSDPGEMQIRHLRDAYYKENYKLQTGIRIAATLGGFFLLVLLTLLYKSKCKKHHSRDPTPLPSLSHLPSSNIPHNSYELDSNYSYHGHNDEDRMGMLDPAQFINMNQIHPYNHCPPSRGGYCHNYPMPSPAVLLTAANSESSDDDMSAASGLDSGLTQPNRPLINQQNNFSKKHSNFNQQSRRQSRHLNPATLSPPVVMGRNGRPQQNIDIHVILPTPTISPSSSEHFGLHQNRHDLQQGIEKSQFNSNGNQKLAGPITLSGGPTRCDRDRSSSVGSTNSNLFVGAFAGNSVFFLDNLKYVDDTSSENIPTNEDQDQDNRSIGSDSVFACFDHNFDHVAPGYSRRISSVSGYSGLNASIRYAGLTTSSSPRERDKSSISGGEEDESDFKMTLTQAQVHHRDSFCSDLESINDYMENSRRRSSSTQTTLSDLQQCLSISWTGSHSPRLSPHFSKQSAVHSRQVMDKLTPGTSSVNSPMMINRFNRKQSVDALLFKKAYSLQCDEPTCLSTNSKRKK